MTIDWDWFCEENDVINHSKYGFIAVVKVLPNRRIFVRDAYLDEILLYKTINYFNKIKQILMK